MSANRDFTRTFEVASVSFARVEDALTPRVSEPTALTWPTPVERMASELGQRLLELARKARRLGPVDQGAVLLVAGCSQDCGVTSLALALGRAASAEYSVGLLDGNLLNADLSRLASRSIHQDWTDALFGTCSFADAQLVLDADRRLTILPLKRAVRAATLAGHSPGEVLSALRQERELVIVDGGPITACHWTEGADASLLVCDPRRTPQKHWAAAWDRLEQGGSQVMGVVEVNTTFPEYQS
jgi:Mrp family chromosome partitioning ATPase